MLKALLAIAAITFVVSAMNIRPRLIQGACCKELNHQQFRTLRQYEGHLEMEQDTPLREQEMRQRTVEKEVQWQLQMNTFMEF